jgi:hypothetical protein
MCNPCHKYKVKPKLMTSNEGTLYRLYSSLGYKPVPTTTTTTTTYTVTTYTYRRRDITELDSQCMSVVSLSTVARSDDFFSKNKNYFIIH